MMLLPTDREMVSRSHLTKLPSYTMNAKPILTRRRKKLSNSLSVKRLLPLPLVKLKLPTRLHGKRLSRRLRKTALPARLRGTTSR